MEESKMLNKKILPIRDFKMAIVCATVLMPLLWAAGRPIDEWALTVAILYVSLWLSREIVVWLLLLALRFLAGYGRRVARKFEVEFPESRPTEHTFLSRLLFFGLVGLASSTVTGVSLFIGILAVGPLGLTPLPLYIGLIAAALLIAGAAGLAFMFSVVVLAFAILNAIHDGFGRRLNHIHAITEKLASAIGE